MLKGPSQLCLNIDLGGLDLPAVFFVLDLPEDDEAPPEALAAACCCLMIASISSLISAILLLCLSKDLLILLKKPMFGIVCFGSFGIFFCESRMNIVFRLL